MNITPQVNQTEIVKMWEKLNFPDRILAIDCETTGLDSRSDRVIELGAVWVTAEGVTTAFDELFSIPNKVPAEITRLTGISNKMLLGQKSFTERLSEIEDIWKSTPALLGHSLVFDVGFVMAEATRTGRSWSLPLWLLDTRNFARLLYPEAPPGGLGSLTKWLGLKHDRPHRALSDAFATGELFRACLPRLNLLCKEECDQLAALANNTRYGFPAEAWTRLRPHVPERKKRVLPLSPWSPSYRKSEGNQSVQLSEIEHELSTDGYASQNLPSFRQRNGQMEYAEWVGKALTNEQWIVLEAGTGVGKTFGYLLPLLAWLAEDSSRRAVISTYSKTLQHQLFHKDLPFWLPRFRGIETTLLKGRNNYICPFRFDDLAAHRSGNISPDEAYHASTLPLWLSWTDTGDASEFVTLRDGSQMMRKVASEPFGCGARGCPNGPIGCFYAKARKLASTAQLVVVNHALLCTYLLYQPQLLGEVNAIVIDEAHRLEEVARDSATVSVSRAVYRNLQEAFTDLAFAFAAAQQNTAFREAQLAIAAIEEAWNSYIHAFTQMIYTTPDSDFGRRKRYLAGDGPAIWFPAASERIDEKITAAISSVTKLKPVFALNDDLRSQVESFELKLVECGVCWKRVRIAEKNSATWWELPPDADPMEVEFFASPVDVSQVLREKLFEAERFGVLTSATLSVDTSFQYYRKAIGLTDTTVDPIEQNVASPFKLKRQLRIAVPMFGPDPWQNGQFDAAGVAEWLSEVLHEAPINTLVLATAKRVGLQFAKALQSHFRGKNHFVWLQGRDGNPAELVEQFRGKQGGILIGYDSFWEGVDLPGTALETIIIPRLPFPVPDDPIQASKSELVKERGGSDFFEVSIPQTILKLKQGIGRMIRLEEDLGVILILDRRILTSRYGEIIRRSLPVEITPLRTQNDLYELFGWLSEGKKQSQ